MGNLIWKLKQLVRQVIPLVLMAAVAWGGYHFVRYGGLKPGRTWSAAQRTLRTFPVFGSYFRGSHGHKSYRHASKHRRRHGVAKRGRRSGHRR